MSRFSPTVLPQPFDLGSVLERIASGYQLARSQRRERIREAREDEAYRQQIEDRNRYLRSLAEADLARPGVSTLPSYLSERLGEAAQAPAPTAPAVSFRGRELATLQTDPRLQNQFREQALRDSPLTPETLSRVARADEAEVPLTFKTPPPTTVRVGNRTFELPGAAPYLTAMGNVMDPERARREASLARALEQYENRLAALPLPEEIAAEAERARALSRARHEGTLPTPEERQAELDYAAARARVTGQYAQRTGAGAGRTPLSLAALERQIDDTRALLETLNRTTYPPMNPDDEVEQEAYRSSLKRMDQLRAELDDLMAQRAQMVARLRGEGAGAGAVYKTLEQTGRQVDPREIFRETARAMGVPAGPQPPAPTAPQQPQLPQSPRPQQPEQAAHLRPTDETLHALLPWLNPSEAQAAFQGQRISVSQQDYDDIVRARGAEYARQHFVVTPR
jgi:hypothetical protein